MGFRGVVDRAQRILFLFHFLGGNHNSLHTKAKRRKTSFFFTVFFIFCLFEGISNAVTQLRLAQIKQRTRVSVWHA